MEKHIPTLSRGIALSLWKARWYQNQKPLLNFKYKGRHLEAINSQSSFVIEKIICLCLGMLAECKSNHMTICHFTFTQDTSFKFSLTASLEVRLKKRWRTCNINLFSFKAFYYSKLTSTNISEKMGNAAGRKLSANWYRKCNYFF